MQSLADPYIPQHRAHMDLGSTVMFLTPLLCANKAIIFVLIFSYGLISGAGLNTGTLPERRRQEQKHGVDFQSSRYHAKRKYHLADVRIT